MRYLRLTDKDREKIKESILAFKKDKKQKFYWNALKDELKKILKKDVKALTSRERDLIEMTLAQVDEWNLINKVKTWVNDRGNYITNGFIMDCDGNQSLNAYERQMKKGFRGLYYSANYHYGLYNPETLELFSYTEGDTSLIKCKDKEHFISEVEEVFRFYIKDGYKKEEGFFDTTLEDVKGEI